MTEPPSHMYRLHHLSIPGSHQGDQISRNICASVEPLDTTAPPPGCNRAPDRDLQSEVYKDEGGARWSSWRVSSAIEWKTKARTPSFSRGQILGAWIKPKLPSSYLPRIGCCQGQGKGRRCASCPAHSEQDGSIWVTISINITVRKMALTHGLFG